MSRFTKRPTDWENVQAFTEFEPLSVGGHIMKVLKVEETKSKKGRDMLVIYFDIAEGEQKGYYKLQYDTDSRPQKKWGGVVYQLIDDANGNTSRGFKTFIESVKKSNSGFDENQIWNENFCSYFKDKLVGGVFGREQYIGNDGKARFSVKCTKFITVEKARAGVPAPEDKLLANQPSSTESFSFGDFGGFTESTDTLPFDN